MEISQQSDLGEDVVVQKVCLIDDEHRVNAGTGAHGEYMLLDGAKHRCPATAWRESEGGAEMSIELHQTDRGVAYIIAFVESGLEPVDEQPNQSALSRAALTGHYTDSSCFDQQFGRTYMPID